MPLRSDSEGIWLALSAARRLLLYWSLLSSTEKKRIFTRSIAAYQVLGICWFGPDKRKKKLQNR